MLVLNIDYGVLFRILQTFEQLDVIDGKFCFNYHLQARSSKLNKLELRFRPEDPCSHPAFGQIHSCNNFLLKISKGNQNNNCSSSQSKDCSSGKYENLNVLSAEIVARVPEAYTFTGEQPMISFSL